MDDVFEDTVEKNGRYLILTQFSEHLLLEILCLTYLMCRREQITLDEVHLVQDGLIHRLGSVRGKQCCIEFPLIKVIINHLE